MSAILVLTPSHLCSASLAIAANRVGEIGVLDLGYRAGTSRPRSELELLRRHVRKESSWGVRWDALGTSGRSLELVGAILGDERVPILVLGGIDTEEFELGVVRQEASKRAEQVFLEVSSLEGALAAEHAGFAGVIVKGFESGGRIGLETTFCLLQRLRGQLGIPFWAQGGIGPDTAASALLAGAAGVVLTEQLWLCTESPLPKSAREKLSGLTGTETSVVGDDRALYRLFSESELEGIEIAIRRGSDWQVLLREGLSTSKLYPVGQDISLASRLASSHVNVAGVVRAYALRSRENFKMACRGEAFAPASPLAESHETRHPIVQGPMTGITIEPGFCELVAEHGALPFLALGGLDVDDAHRRLTETKQRLGERPWGAALGGPIDSSLRARHLELLGTVRPPYALVDLRESEQGLALEKEGVRTYIHVDTPESLEELLRSGHRRFVFEGSETGGPVGPRSSFSLWQSAIDALSSFPIRDPESLHLIFAGPIHDSLSAAMTAAAVAPLTARGMKVGIQLGSAYFFTPESVAGGTVTATFHERVLSCRGTAILAVPGGAMVRCARTPFVEEFHATRADLTHSGRTQAEISGILGRWLGDRLVLAAKGLEKGRPADAEHQESKGLYQVGEVVTLRDRPVSMCALHEEVSQESVVLLERLASEHPAWRETVRAARPKSDDIAIVGMACMFPKANDLRTYWENICRRVDAIEEVPAERWDAEAYFDSDRLARDRVYSKWGGFLGSIVFDPMKWRIPPASLKSIEPIQLFSLEVASAAMRDAGYDRREFPRERTGVIFACAGSHDLGSGYAFRTMMRHYLPQVEGITQAQREAIEESLSEQLPEWTEDSFPGFLLNVIAGRIARELNVNGPNYTVDAACAASMAAFHAAIEQLRSRTSDMVLVGGADATNNPFCYMSFAKTHALSPRGRSRPFDESGDGISLGEGIGAVVLKRLKDAEEDGDKIYAVIKGIGSSSDGKNKSLTAPHPPGQIKAVERAYEDAGVSPVTVSLIEAHGTGTVVGDSAEITTLNEVFSSRTSEKQFAAVGSVKSMIGHTKTVAGMASVIKTAMALKHRVLPPTIGVEQPTSRFDFSESPFYVNTQTRPWIEELGTHPRRAGVSAFGFGGTNFHMVMEEYSGSYLPDRDENLTPRSSEVLLIARESRDAVREVIGTLVSRLSEVPVTDLAKLCASVNRDFGGRASEARTHRLGVVAESVEDLLKKLQRAEGLLQDRAELTDPTGIYYSEAPAVREEEVCFLYPGQGSQSVNMLGDLLAGCPWGQGLLSGANRALGEFLPQPLSRYIYPPPSFDDESRAAAFRSLSDTRVAQPALGVVEVFATELLERYGVRPGSSAGHSYGEHVALYAAGVLSRSELLWLSAMRGRVCAEIAATSPGGMAAVQADAKRTEELVKASGVRVYLANMNAPDQTILAGSEADIDAAVEFISGQGVRAKRIPVSAPFHTPLLEAGSTQMAEHFARASFQKPRIPVYSNTTGERHSEDPSSLRSLLSRHFSEPVHFEEEIRRIHSDGARVFVECGPGKVLSELVGRILKGEAVAAVPIDVPGREGWTQFGHAIARLYSLGVPVHESEWYEGRGLADVGFEAFLAEEKERQTRKRSDWILSPTGARPALEAGSTKGKANVVSAAKAASGASPGEPIAARPEAVVAAATEESQNEFRTPSSEPADSALTAQARSVEQPTMSGPAGNLPSALQTVSRTSVRPKLGLKSSSPRRVRPPTRSLPRNVQTMNGATNSNVPVNGSSGHPGSVELYMEFQASTRMFLEFQQSQQLLMERFLETQERLLLCCLGQPPAMMPSAANGAVAERPAAVAGAISAPAAPVARPIAAVPAAASVAPPRVAAAVPTARTNSAAPPSVPVSPAKPAPVKAAPVAAPAVVKAASAPVAAAAANGSASDGPPPVEEFRRDLLAVISERTGYPEDMLDETLPLEAGLGIDSIKTVEIFSTLKQYHRFMREEGVDEEEALAEFTSLKTIKDILDSYSRRIANWKGGSSAKEPMNGTAKSNGVAKNGVVERHSVTADAVPSAAVASKKNSLTSS